MQKESQTTSAREYTAGRFTATCQNDGYPVLATITQDGEAKMIVSHQDLTDLQHVLLRMHVHLYYHRELSGLSHEVE